jgi:purine-binding chemotaxis protein CheW
MDNRHLDWESARKRLAAYQQALEASAIDDPERMERIYHLRAEQLAQSSTQQQDTQIEAILTFRLAGARFGVRLADVAEVISHPKIAPVPGAGADIAGVIQVRGEIRAVMNLRSTLELAMPESGLPPEPQIVLLRRGGQVIGILTDSIEDTFSVGPEDRRLPSDVNVPGSWITADFVTVLNSDGLFDKFQDSKQL